MTDRPLERRIAELESITDDQQARIEELESQVATVEDDKQSLEDRVAELEAYKASLETQVANLQADNESLAAENESLEEHVAALQADNESLEAKLAEVQTENGQLHDRIDRLEAQPEVTVADESDPIGSLHIAGAPVGQAIKSKPGQSDLDAELDALREELETFADTEAAEPAEPTVEPQTPLEQIVALPGAVVEEQLTANQRRARFVAKDITEYAAKTPAGWVLTPKDLRTVLNAAFDTGHSQTCSRVRTILADLGDEDASIKDSRGEKKLVVDPKLVGRLREIENTDHDVVSHSEG